VNALLGGLAQTIAIILLAACAALLAPFGLLVVGPAGRIAGIW
jgi:hypothetical protein